MRLLTTLAVLAAALLAAPSSALAQAYPTKPVKVIVPYPPGQGTDVATRLLAEHLGKALGQTVVVENRAGAGGNIGTAEAARAPADGYTLLMGTNATHVLNQYLFANMAFDPDKDFEPVMHVTTLSMVVLAPAASPYNSLADVLADARAKPDNVAVALPSTTARLVLELLRQQSGAALRGIPYKGSGVSMTDLIGGQVPLAVDTVSAARGHVAGGRVKALAVTSLDASPLLPTVKPVAAQGLEGFQVIAWNALYAPRGTPPAVVNRIATELSRILTQPDVRQRLFDMGHEPVGGSATDLAAFARAERQKWGPLIQKVGLKAE
jgi:tripartite-type tricarboxylate transporter receptor subunit TctC